MNSSAESQIRSEDWPAAPGVEVRSLVYSDLPSVLSIERRAFGTPWSLAMFVLELSKPSGICLAASDEDGLVGYLVCSRYADVWHVMNVAVDPDRRREGSRRGCSSGCSRRPAQEARYTLEVRTSNQRRDRHVRALRLRAAGHRRRYYHDNGEDAVIMWLEPAPVGA